jgi:hypothetical protein
MEDQDTLAISESQPRFENCLVCKWPFDARSVESVRIFCSVCSDLGDVRINLRFLEGGGRKDRNIASKAYTLTGRSGICVSILKRLNGLIRFEFDLWRVDWNIRAEVREQLGQRWSAQMAIHAVKFKKRRLECCFSKTFAFFDVLPEYADYWKTILTAVLTNNAGLEYIK